MTNVTANDVRSKMPSGFEPCSVDILHGLLIEGILTAALYDQNHVNISGILTCDKGKEYMLLYAQYEQRQSHPNQHSLVRTRCWPDVIGKLIRNGFTIVEANELDCNAHVYDLTIWWI